MLVGRFAMIIPILAIAGSLAAKRRVAPSRRARSPPPAPSSWSSWSGSWSSSAPSTSSPRWRSARSSSTSSSRLGRSSRDPRHRTRHPPLPALRPARRPASPAAEPPAVRGHPRSRAAPGRPPRRRSASWTRASSPATRSCSSWSSRRSWSRVIAVLRLGRPRDRRRHGHRVRRPDRGLAVVHRPVRDLRRGRRRGARPGPGGDAAQDPLGDDGPPARRRTARSPTSAAPSSGPATSSSSARARRSRPTATSSRAWPTSTRPRSPASPRPSSRSPARTSARASPAAPPSSPTSWSSASPPTRARPSWTG